MPKLHWRSVMVGGAGVMLCAIALGQASQPTRRCVGIAVTKMDRGFNHVKYGQIEAFSDVVYRAFDDGSIERSIASEKGWIPWAKVEPATASP